MGQGGTARAGDCDFFYEKGNENQQYVVLRGRWRNIIVVNVHAPSEEKSDESKDSFYEELEQPRIETGGGCL